MRIMGKQVLDDTSLYNCINNTPAHVYQRVCICISKKNRNTNIVVRRSCWTMEIEYFALHPRIKYKNKQAGATEGPLYSLQTTTYQPVQGRLIHLPDAPCEDTRTCS